jgi:hypothetical protein
MDAVAALLEDAYMPTTKGTKRSSNRRAYILSVDLSKAFDSCEYWSQAASWAAFGMPEEAIKLLVQMDSTASTRVALGAGRYTDPVPHGRGVRQGSILGPLKWVVFMNWWVRGVEHSLKGRGYTFKANSYEFISQMFIDDSIWATETAAAMKEIIGMHEVWATLHALKINRKKTEMLIVNPNPDLPPMRWRTGELVPVVPQAQTSRYLGAFFSPHCSWADQNSRLAAKQQELTAVLVANAKRLSIREGRYLLNSKIHPAIAYPHRVAISSLTALQALDSGRRAALARIANITLAETPVEMFFLPPHMGGWGLKSAEWSYYTQNVRNWVESLTSPPHTRARRTAEALLLAHKVRNGCGDNPLAKPGLHKTPPTQVAKL